jgi:hypothetical protein
LLTPTFFSICGVAVAHAASSFGKWCRIQLA